MLMNTKNKSGFTLIEVLIVVSIIGLLSSVVLIGLGGFRTKGADTRRIADLHQAQTALELYYSKNSLYPPSSTWAVLEDTLVGAAIGVKNLSNDPTSGATYLYGSSGQGYTLGAKLKGADPALDNDVDGGSDSINCNDPTYCVSF